jgi:GWxTD domain-containing protein
MKLLFPTCYPVRFLPALFCVISVMAQNERAAKSAPETQQINKPKRTSSCLDAPGRPTSKQRLDKAIARLPEPARLWLTEDVADLISPEERCTFLLLRTDQERNQFIEQFWVRRAPDPKSLYNGFKQEHYERIVFANEKFTDQIPGWQTDRGRAYVTFGPPDSIESRRSGEKTGRPPEEGNETVQYSWEAWHYKHIEGVQENLELDFVDPSGSGNYRLTMPAEERDELIFAPRYNLGRSSRLVGSGEAAEPFGMYIGPAPTPLVQYKDLEAVVVSRIVRDEIRINHRIEFLKATHVTTQARILVYPSDEHAGPPNSDRDSSAGFEVFGRLSKPSGWVVETFENKISLVERGDSVQDEPNCQFNVAIAPGTYRLVIAVKNTVTEEVGVLHATIDVPSYEKLNAQK